MEIIRDTELISQEKESVVLIGKFDGFHRGHQKLAAVAVRDRQEGQQTVLFTFSRPPQGVLTGRGETGITTREERRKLAEAAGVDVLIEYPFTEEVRRMPAEVFLRRILLEQLRMKEIVAGPDCAFGFQRRGNVDFLLEHQAEGGYVTRIVEKEIYGREVISSQRIRACLSEGRVEEAEAMLGAPFRFCSPVVRGKQLGRRIGFPTINQEIPAEKFLPAFGVYATEVILEGKRWQGISNVGVKPTVSGGNAAGVETYLYEYAGDAYEKEAVVELKHFIRPERKFGSIEELRQQIGRDRRAAEAAGKSPEAGRKDTGNPWKE